MHAEICLHQSLYKASLTDCADFPSVIIFSSHESSFCYSMEINTDMLFLSLLSLQPVIAPLI